MKKKRIKKIKGYDDVIEGKYGGIVVGREIVILRDKINEIIEVLNDKKPKNKKGGPEN